LRELLQHWSPNLGCWGGGGRASAGVASQLLPLLAGSHGLVPLLASAQQTPPLLLGLRASVPLLLPAQLWLPEPLQQAGRVLGKLPPPPEELVPRQHRAWQQHEAGPGLGLPQQGPQGGCLHLEALSAVQDGFPVLAPPAEAGWGAPALRQPPPCQVEAGWGALALRQAPV
jgi:hypothetical protein